MNTLLPLGRALLACLITISSSGLFSTGTAGCGPALPHEHLLLGGAGLADLTRHLTEEAACRAGKLKVAIEPPDGPAHRGKVLSVFDHPQHSTSLLTDLTLTAHVAAVLGPQMPADVWLSEAAARWLGTSLEAPPPTPPPCSNPPAA